MTQGGGVLCSQVAQTGSGFRGSGRGLIYVGSGLGLDLHMSCGKKTPARSNRFESSLLLGEENSIN
jgi:hypothetical protein